MSTKRPRQQAIRARCAEQRGDALLTAVFLVAGIIMIAATRFGGGA